MKKFDFFIVGQGIAGTVLSHQLTKNGFSVYVFDFPKPNSASRIAAGAFNPVAYRKLVPAEYVDFILPEMLNYYSELERELAAPFFNLSSFLKLFADIEEYNNWQNQCALEKHSAYMLHDIYRGNFNKAIKNPFGAGQVLQSGYLNLPVLLNEWQACLSENNNLHVGPFIHQNLSILNGRFHYTDICAEKIVFCEGVGVSQNPWFNWLPIQQFKGEIIDIYAPDLKVDRVLNRGVFLMPIGANRYKVGSTHDWRHVDELRSLAGKNELIEKLDKIIDVPYTIVSHDVGLRPASRDRRPFIGRHPAHKNMFVLNGLGSKGVMMAPWLCKIFISGLNHENWPIAFDIKRYVRYYNDK